MPKNIMQAFVTCFLRYFKLKMKKNGLEFKL